MGELIPGSRLYELLVANELHSTFEQLVARRRCVIWWRGKGLTFSSQTAVLLKALLHVGCFTPPFSCWLSSFRFELFDILCSFLGTKTTRSYNPKAGAQSHAQTSDDVQKITRGEFSKGIKEFALRWSDRFRSLTERLVRLRNVVWPSPEPANQKVRRFRCGNLW